MKKFTIVFGQGFGRDREIRRGGDVAFAGTWKSEVEWTEEVILEHFKIRKMVRNVLDKGTPIIDQIENCDFVGEGWCLPPKSLADRLERVKNKFLQEIA